MNSQFRLTCLKMAPIWFLIPVCRLKRKAGKFDNCTTAQFKPVKMELRQRLIFFVSGKPNQLPFTNANSFGGFYRIWIDGVVRAGTYGSGGTSGYEFPGTNFGLTNATMAYLIHHQQPLSFWIKPVQILPISILPEF